ncbi:MAG: hypothetical protein BHV90_17070 [Clostridiales bacterium 42_27]|nr:MAG: hypothetical protein BHV90_17070 [Clostridiales bacterium 42_27]
MWYGWISIQTNCYRGIDQYITKQSGACLKKAFCKMCVTICGIFCPDEGAVAGILAMTANAFDEDRKKALACGMDGFLSKPIVIEELISTLQNSLG